MTYIPQRKFVIAPIFSEIVEHQMDLRVLFDVSRSKVGRQPVEMHTDAEGRSKLPTVMPREMLLEQAEIALKEAKLELEYIELMTGTLRQNVINSQQPWFLLAPPNTTKDRPAILNWRHRQMAGRKTPWIGWAAWESELARTDVPDTWRDWFHHMTDVAETVNFASRHAYNTHRLLAEYVEGIKSRMP